MHRYQASFQLLLVEKKSGAAAPQQQQQQQLQLQLRYNNLYSLQLAATTTKLIMSISSCSLRSTRKLVLQVFYSKLIPPPPPPPPAPPPAVRHGHGIHSFRSFAMGTHMPLELGSYVATQRRLLVLLSHCSKCKLRCCCCCCAATGQTCCSSAGAPELLFFCTHKAAPKR